MKDSTLKIILSTIAIGAGTVVSTLGIIGFYEGIKEKSFEDAVEEGRITVSDF